jgi:hypothetical protein
MTDLPDLPSPTPEERELSRKLAELAELEEMLAGRERALAKLEVELRIFEVQYLATVGKRYAELDEIEAEVAEAASHRNPEDLDLYERAEAARARAHESADALGSARAPVEERLGPPPESLKQLFRQIARLIHPDLAEDDRTRAKREELMAAANRAYRTGKEEELAAILRDWEESPEAVAGHDAAAELLRAVRQVAHVQERIETLDRQIEELKQSELYQLRLQVEGAEAAGRDLLAEMAAAVEPQIEAARTRLEAVRHE